MEKQKHEMAVLKRAKQVAVASHAHKCTPKDSEARKQAGSAKWWAVEDLTRSVEIAERAGVEFDGSGEP